MEGTVTGMEGIVSALSTGLSADSLLGVVAQLVPFLIIIVPACLGIYFLRKLVNGASKAKVKF